MGHTYYVTFSIDNDFIRGLHTERSYWIPSKDLFHQGVNIRQTDPIFERRKAVMAYDRVDFGLCTFLDLWIERHCKKKRVDE